MALTLAAGVPTGKAEARVSNWDGSAAHRATIDRYLSRMAGFGFSSSVLVVDGGKLVLEKGYGPANRATRAPITGNTPFNIGSLTKQFTAAAILHLEQEGRLSTGDPISKHLPGVPPGKAAITIHQLLTQTGGIARQVVGPNNRLDRDETVAKILAAPLASKPGVEFHYSNSGYQLLAAIVEHASSKPFATYLRDTFFTRLGMSATGTVQEDRWREHNIAHAYNEWKALGSWKDWPRGWNDGTGNGNIVSTADDLRKWMFALRDNRALDAAETAKLFQRYVAADEPGQFYGYGWYLVPGPSGDVVYHGGDNPGYHSELRWNRARNRMIVVLTNAEFFDESGSGLGLHKKIMASAIATALNDQPLTMPPASVKLSAAESSQLVGSYMVSGGNLMISNGNGALTVAADGQAAANLLLRPDAAQAARFAALNAKATVLLALMASHDLAGLKSALSAADQFYINGWLSDWGDFRRSLGDYVGLAHLASIAMPWDANLVRTTAILKFQHGTMDFQFSWDREALTETLDGRGLTHDVILPAAASSRTVVTVYEPISGRALHVRLRLHSRLRAASVTD